MSKFCDACTDGDGGCRYPWYGLAPHKHTPGVLGGTEFTEEYPENFSPDIEEPGMGVYTHCLKCGAPD